MSVCETPPVGEDFALEDSFLIRCSKCKGSFRDKARRVQNGCSRQCPLCERVLFFEEGTPDKNTQKALTDARHLRKALREHEDIKRFAASFKFVRS
jgi:hypothetical protein